MELIRRIAPDEVVEAYQKTGLRPVIGDWAYLDEDDRPCACGLTAIYAYETRNLEDTRTKIRTIDSLVQDDFGPEELFEEEIGLSPGYITGFTLGFDGQHLVNPLEPNTVLGYEDGKAARERIFRLERDAFGTEQMVPNI